MVEHEPAHRLATCKSLLCSRSHELLLALAAWPFIILPSQHMPYESREMFQSNRASQLVSLHPHGIPNSPSKALHAQLHRLHASIVPLHMSDRTFVLMPSLKEIVDRRDEQDTAEHRGRPIPKMPVISTSLSGLTLLVSLDLHVRSSDWIAQRPRVEEQHRRREAQ